ncbi:MAG: hypothetical protein SEPTF4163_005278 [Sporothrix epigloea]
MRPPSDTRYQQDVQDVSQQRHYQHSGSPGGERQQLLPTGSRVLGSGGAPTSYGGYYQESPGSAYTAGAHGAMTYPPPPADYTQDARHSQGFASTYHPPNTQMIYGVPQTSSQGTVLDSAQPFASRQHAGLQIMASGVAPSAYFAGDTSTAASLALHQQSAQGGPSSAIYQQQAPSNIRSGASVGYGAGMEPPIVMGSHGAQQTFRASSGRSMSSAVASETQDYAEIHESFTSYQRNLKDVFKSINSGDLESASESLLSISDWLLSRVEFLGLTSDNEELYESRIKLWKNFNNAWLGLLEKQKQTMWPENAVQESQNVITFENLRKMGRELVRLCDGIERFGLVDYEYGVWEERIMAVLTDCVELYKITDEETTDAASGLG